MTTELHDGTPAATDNTPAPSGNDPGGASSGQPTGADTILADLDVGDVGESGESGETDDVSDAGADADGGADAERPAWARPAELIGPDADPDAIAEWKESQGLPTSVDDYEIDLGLAEGEAVSEVGQQLLTGLKEVGVENDVPEPALNKVANWYKGFVAAQQVKLAEGDQKSATEARTALAKAWGGPENYTKNITTIREFLGDAKRIAPDAAAAITSARTPDGRRLINNPVVADILLQAARGQSAPQTARTIAARPAAKGQQNVTEALKAELAEITELQNRDVDDLFRPWKASGMNASDRRLAIMRQLNDAASEQEHQATMRNAATDEERQLLDLHRNDLAFFEHGRWRDSGVTPARRLYALRNGRS